MPLTFAPQSPDALPLRVVAADALGDLDETLDAPGRAWRDAQGFSAALGETLVIPGADGTPQMALVGWGDAPARARVRFALAGARARLPAGPWRLEGLDDPDDLAEAALGWLLAGYRFDRYKAQEPPRAQLVAPDGVDAARLETIAAAEDLTRDLINTPAADMGPGDLADAARTLADEFAAQVTVTEGEALLAANLPLIHAVGRAAAAERAPRLIDLRWGTSGPSLTLVGKGVCFDTGGLNLKPGASMGLMKKDMGGAANVLGLARMIMATGMNLRLRVLIPAVENSVSGASYRPQDILTSRKGLTIEINNTDAEGRVVLADALALADEEKPDLIVSMATLTGAARVAVGPDLVPFYATDDGHAHALARAARQVRDPLWRMPFWDPYEPLLEPGIADLDNAPKGGMAGSIMAALLLRRFVTDTPAYLHFDVYGWQPKAAPARPHGGVGQATRALFAALPGLLEG